MWNLLKMFGYARLEDLNGHLIHRLENVLTLTRELHGSMDKLELWFEYTVCLHWNDATRWLLSTSTPRERLTSTKSV